MRTSRLCTHKGFSSVLEESRSRCLSCHVVVRVLGSCAHGTLNSIQRKEGSSLSHLECFWRIQFEGKVLHKLGYNHLHLHLKWEPARNQREQSPRPAISLRRHHATPPLRYLATPPPRYHTISLSQYYPKNLSQTGSRTIETEMGWITVETNLCEHLADTVPWAQRERKVGVSRYFSFCLRIEPLWQKLVRLLHHARMSVSPDDVHL